MAESPDDRDEGAPDNEEKQWQAEAPAEDKTAEGEDAGPSGAPGEGPGSGGYGTLDPKKDMPRVPSAPETQSDPETHEGAPDPSGDGPTVP